MPKLKRCYEEGMSYFITAVTAGRNPLFNDTKACELLINIFVYYKFVNDYVIYGFVIMPDHFHMIIKPAIYKDISAIMRNIKGSFTRFYNKMTGTRTIIWQRSFHDRGLRNSEAVINTLQYMHHNPVRKGMVENSLNYEYSSCGYYEHEDRRFEILLDRIEV